MTQKELEELESELKGDLSNLWKAEKCIQEELEKRAKPKKLKKNDPVGGLGLIYGKLLKDGELDSGQSHEFKTKKGERILVKTRKGNAGDDWNKTGKISKIEGDDLPTHLMFVHFNDDYSLDKIWLYPWEYLKNRFKKNKDNKYSFEVDPKSDEKYLIYPNK